MRIARVLVESPVPRLDRLLDYEIPERLESDAIEGVRVKVPLGRGSRLVEGFIVNFAEQTQSGVVLSAIDSVLGKVSVLTPALWALVRSAADRNGGSASDILRLAAAYAFAGVHVEHSRPF
jgi:primosomal protein N' (replication factor Y)